MMTPQEINDYKNKWKMTAYFLVHVHSDDRAKVREWCKDFCFQWRYDIKTLTDNYTDTVSFQLSEDCDAFQEWYEGTDNV